MHTEHLQNVRIVNVLAGWLISIAIASLAMLAAIGVTRILRPDALEIGPAAGLIAVIVGFWLGGFTTGFRALRAPILNGVGIGLTSLVAAAGLNAIVGLLDPGVVWDALTPALTVALLLAQIAAAVVGALMGYNVALRGKPSLAEHEPID
jgi:hypothetical protein